MPSAEPGYDAIQKAVSSHGVRVSVNQPEMKETSGVFIPAGNSFDPRPGKTPGMIRARLKGCAKSVST
jgi:hypothetical protein